MKECKSKRSSGCQRRGEKSRRQVAEGGERGGDRGRELSQQGAFTGTRSGFLGENIVVQ